jgi:hypothetical protein
MHAVLYVTPSLLVFMRFALDDVVIVGLNNGPAEVDLQVPIQSNPGIPKVMRDKMIEGLELSGVFDAAQRVRVTGGSVRLKLAARSAAVYRARPPAQLGPARRYLARRQGVTAPTSSSQPAFPAAEKVLDWSRP